MRRLRHRLAAAGERRAAAEPAPPEPSAAERWLGVLRVVLPALERIGEAAAAARAGDGIGLLEWYVAGQQASDPWAYLEYYCRACVLRMSWPGFAPAFLDPAYDGQWGEVVAGERARRGPPGVIAEEVL